MRLYIYILEKIYVMEYAVSITVTIIFILLYAITKRTEREGFSKYTSENEYSYLLEKQLKNFDLPSKNGKKEYSVTKFIRKIKYASFLCKLHTKKHHTFNRPYIKELEFFQQIVEGNKSILKKISKLDFSKLDEMPSNSKSPRIETMWRFVLEGNNFEFSENRLSLTFDFFNKISTITFPEIQNFKLMANYILVEKMNFVATRIQNLIRVANYAQRVVAHPRFYERRKFYGQVKTNNIFLHFSSSLQNLDCPSADLVYYDVIENINRISQTIFNELEYVEFYDFSKFYTPIKFLNNFIVFCDAPYDTQISFLTELSHQSSLLNIDELAYTYSLIKYFKREELLFFKTNRFQLFGRFVNFTAFKSNMKTLSIALKSTMAMNLIFAPKKRKFDKV